MIAGTCWICCTAATTAASGNSGTRSSNCISRSGRSPFVADLLSLQIYLIAEQERRHVTVFQRDGEYWQVTFYSAGSAIPLPFLGVTVSLEECRWKM